MLLKHHKYSILRETLLILSLLLHSSNSLQLPAAVKFLNPMRYMRSQFSNLETIKTLKEQQKQPIIADQNSIDAFNSCQNDNVHNYKLLVGLHYLFAVEGFNATLSCGHCVPQKAAYKWRRLTFNNQETVITSGMNSVSTDLYLPSMESEDTTYYCSWGSDSMVNIGNIWTVEVVAADHLEYVQRKQWSNPAYTAGGLNILWRYTPWSDCNTCGKVGQRHRFAYCTLLSNRGSQWTALHTYDYISCFQFLFLHPEYEKTYENMTEILEANPKILLGYCKPQCSKYNYDLEPEHDFNRMTPDSIKWFYTEGRHFKNSRRPRRYHGSLLNFRLPIGWSTLPEMIVLIVVLYIQAYVIIHVCTNRKNAR